MKKLTAIALTIFTSAMAFITVLIPNPDTGARFDGATIFWFLVAVSSFLWTRSLLAPPAPSPLPRTAAEQEEEEVRARRVIKLTADPVNTPRVPR
jgi:hypothetical protein